MGLTFLTRAVLDVLGNGSLTKTILLQGCGGPLKWERGAKVKHPIGTLLAHDSPLPPARFEASPGPVPRQVIFNWAIRVHGDREYLESAELLDQGPFGLIVGREFLVEVRPPVCKQYFGTGEPYSAPQLA